MAWFSLERFHPINRIAAFAINSGILLILGMPPIAVLPNKLVRHDSYFIHADLPWTFATPERSLSHLPCTDGIMRPHLKAFNTNYATVFSQFDRALGTYRVPARSPDPLASPHPAQPSSQCP
jgi:sterol desaturase/sphingolipid hydroxylase (fatty acid hydroxylase superfamily)